MRLIDKYYFLKKTIEITKSPPRFLIFNNKKIGAVSEEIHQVADFCIY